jgi:hypothetical protein
MHRLTVSGAVLVRVPDVAGHRNLPVPLPRATESRAYSVNSSALRLPLAPIGCKTDAALRALARNPPS